jgi:hypothetical protein
VCAGSAGLTEVIEEHYYDGTPVQKRNVKLGIPSHLRMHSDKTASIACLR